MLDFTPQTPPVPKLHHEIAASTIAKMLNGTKCSINLYAI